MPWQGSSPPSLSAELFCFENPEDLDLFSLDLLFSPATRELCPVAGFQLQRDQNPLPAGCQDHDFWDGCIPDGLLGELESHFLFTDT